MLDAALVDPISLMITQAILNRFVIGDRVMFSICGNFDYPRWPILKGTVTEISGKIISVKIDNELRNDMKIQSFYIGNSNLRRIEE